MAVRHLASNSAGWYDDEVNILEETMSTIPRLEFGYCPPAGHRNFETIRPAQFVSDLHHVLDVVTQGFTSLWMPDHFQLGSNYRLECWTLLTWLAARYPNVKLGAIVMGNSYRPPA